MENFIICEAKLEDMDFLLKLAQNEGWNPGLHDAAPFYYTDPRGFFIGLLDGEKIGCISAVAYDNIYGFIGLYIVLPTYRGHGYGLKLWQHAMDYLGQRIVGLDGVIAQQANYKKSHFQLHYRNIRFEGQAQAIFKNSTLSNSLIDLHKIPLEIVLEYDIPIFGLRRENFLRQWLDMPNAYALGKVDSGRLQGYGVIRKCINGFKIGPLFADDYHSAAALYKGLCEQAGNNPIFLDVPEINQAGLQLAENAQLQKVFETARMYNRVPPASQIHKIFGVTSFELG